MALLLEVATYIQSTGIASMGVDLFAGGLPGHPDNVVVLHQPRPGDAIRTMSKTLDHVVEPFTLTVRDLDPDVGYTKIWAVFNLIDNFTGELSGVPYKLIWGRGIPFELGPDENQRTRWSCDFFASKIPS